MKKISSIYSWPVIALAGSLLFFALFPNFDLWVTGNFYDPERGGFVYAHNNIVQFSYRLFSNMHWPVIWSIIAFWVAMRYLFNQQKRNHQIAAIYLLLALLLGPGLTVNSLFKSEWGRARPVNVTEFGGARQYSPPLKPAANCEYNCSFVSGHASMGFYFISLAWIFNRKRWLIIGTTIGATVGFGRILQGGHFFSDIIFAFWSVYLTCALLAWLLNLPKRLHTHEPISYTPLKKRLIALIGVVTVVAIVYAGWAKEYIATNRCLEAGGTYDVEHVVCIFEGAKAAASN